MSLYHLITIWSKFYGKEWLQHSWESYTSTAVTIPNVIVIQVAMRAKEFLVFYYEVVINGWLFLYIYMWSYIWMLNMILFCRGCGEIGVRDCMWVVRECKTMMLCVLCWAQSYRVPSSNFYCLISWRCASSESCRDFSCGGWLCSYFV